MKKDKEKRFIENKNDRVELSIILPCRNEEKALSHCLDKIKKVRFTLLEIDRKSNGRFKIDFSYPAELKEVMAAAALKGKNQCI